MSTFSSELDTMMQDVIDTFGVSLTLTRKAVTGFTTATGAEPGSTVSQSIDAVRMDSVQFAKRAGAEGGRAMVEERVYEIAAADLDSATIDGFAGTTATVVDGAWTGEIVKWELNTDKKCWRLTVRSVR